MNSDHDAKAPVEEKIHNSIRKLRFVYDIQHKDSWYMSTVRLKASDVDQVNDEFAKLFGDNFYELGLNLGSSLSGQDLTTELYKFNETLTRLLSHHASLSTTTTRNSDIQTIDSSENFVFLNKLDSTLLIKSITKLLILKLHKMSELVSSERRLNALEVKLVEDILAKNISNRFLKTYHNLLFMKAQLHISNIY